MGISPFPYAEAEGGTVWVHSPMRLGETPTSHLADANETAPPSLEGGAAFGVPGKAGMRAGQVSLVFGLSPPLKNVRTT